MKKKLLTLFMTSVMAFSLIACGGSGSTTTNGSGDKAASTSEDASSGSDAAESDTGSTEGIQADEAFYAKADLKSLKGKKLGITIQSLQNAYWAGVMSALEDILKENGAEYTIVACDDNSSQQVGQIENFISSKCDLIMVHPSDANAVEDVCKEAKDAGIKVMCWDDPMTNTDGNWILNNTDLGIAIGELAGDFIAEHYTDSKKAEVALIDYPQTKVLKERGDGIQQGLKNKADGKYEIVAEQPAIEANKAQTAMETILQANPDCKVVAGVGAGAMIGANEALVTATGGKIPEDMGVFTTDVTKDQLKQLLDKKAASKGIIGFEGSDVDTATACASMYALILGGKLDQQNVFRQVGPITEENAQEIMDEMK